MSADGSQAVTMIAFIGSVFSPYYAWANRRRAAPAENFCAMNVALYQQRGGAWAMTERKAASLQTSAGHVQIGPSALHWDGTTLTAQINEHCAPIPRRLRGTIKLRPAALQNRIFTLDAAARHRWQPLALQAGVEVDFPAQGVSWQGRGYFDTNDGDVPLAEDFSTWHWGCFGNKILYDVHYPNGGQRSIALAIAADGTAASLLPAGRQPLPHTMWRLERQTRSDAAFQPRVVKTLEDTPFYARSIVETKIDGDRHAGVHESLSLRRFASPLVQMMLPFRMPRWG